jgi:GTP cyclohydrolase I
MKDTQNETDNRNVKLDIVGVRGVMLPIKVKDKFKGDQYVQANVNAFVSLEKTQKGIHMSHIVDPLFKLKDNYGLDNLVKVATMIKDIQSKENRNLITSSCTLNLSFKYFVNKIAPESKEQSIMSYDMMMEVKVGKNGYKLSKIRVPVSTCCPCSLDLCGGIAAHNQRGYITITAIQDNNDTRNIWFEDIIAIAERSGSCEIFPVLRRPDEKYVTNKMFANAKFVEDVVRDTIVNLRTKYKKVKFIVSCENMESIHDHSAYAETEFRS